VIESGRRIPVMLRPGRFAIHRSSSPTSRSTGGAVAAGRLAQLEQIEGPVRIDHENASRFSIVRPASAKRDLVASSTRRERLQITVPLGARRLQWGGQFENQQRACWCCQRAIRRGRGVVALAVSGEYLSVPASIGFIALLGIAVLNGVVLVSHFNELLDQGLSLDQCVRRGSVRRLRPVLMTAAITALGMVPLLFASGPGSEIQRPLAIVVVGGLLSSTLLTLVLLPLLFARFGQERRGAPAAAPSTPAMPVSGNP
jgi:cobalt-zinc-cadmium resistance protein CzcA